MALGRLTDQKWKRALIVAVVTFTIILLTWLLSTPGSGWALLSGLFLVMLAVAGTVLLVVAVGVMIIEWVENGKIF